MPICMILYVEVVGGVLLPCTLLADVSLLTKMGQSNMIGLDQSSLDVCGVQETSCGIDKCLKKRNIATCEHAQEKEHYTC